MTLDGVRLIAFDLDGTLVDFLAAKRRAAEAAAWALADAGLDLDVARAAREMREVAAHVGPDHDDVAEEWLRRRGHDDPRLLAVARAAYEKGEAEAAAPYPRAARTLAELRRRGYLLAVVTDADRHRALRRLAGAGLLSHFTHVLAREDTPRGKEEPAPFRLLAERAGLPPAAILAVGDNPRLDVESASEAGCRTALAAYGLTARFANAAAEARADVRLAWIDQLLHHLPGQNDSNFRETMKSGPSPIPPEAPRTEAFA